MNSGNGLICFSLAVFLAAPVWPVAAAPVDRAGVGAMARGWLAAGRARLGSTMPDAVKTVESFGEFHVVHLEPDGFVVAAADDDLESIIAFSAKGKFSTDPENPLWILLHQDLPARSAHVRRVMDRHKNHQRTAPLPKNDPDGETVRESVRNQTKWEHFRSHAPAMKSASTGVVPGGGAGPAPMPGSASNAAPPSTFVPIKNIRVVDGQVQISHDSLSSVSILASYDEGRSWQTLDSGIYQSTWVSDRAARESAGWFRVEEDGLLDEMTVNFMRHPPPALESANDMVAAPNPNALSDVPLSSANLLTVSDVRIAPLVQSQWNQATAQGQNCYNYYTPNNYVCGCVATALAQLIRYWQYPVAGIGQITRTIYVNGSTTTGTTRGGNGAGGPYNWSRMPLNPGSMPYDGAQWQMIGALCYDAGVSVNMQYASGASGAYMSTCAAALTGAFGYADAHYINYPADRLPAINSNLEAGYPVLLGIRSSSNGSGHAIVCDGFGYASGTLYHHLNLGWGGTVDAWYTLPNIGAYYGFDSVETIIFNIFPTGTGELISGRVATTQGAPVQSATVAATYSTQTYTATSDAKGYYGIRVPGGLSYSVAASKTGMSTTTRSGVTVGTSSPSVCGNATDVDFALSSFSFTAVALTNSVWLRWTAPTNCGMPNNTVYIRWRTDLYPTNTSDGTEIYSGTAQVFEHTGLDSSGTVTNFYAIWGNNGTPYASIDGNTPQVSAVPDLGDLRLYWKGKTDGALYTWILATNGTKKASVQPATGNYSQYDVISTLDVNGDGRPELLWKGKSNGLIYLWFMNPDGTRASSVQPASGDYSQ